MLTTLPDKKDAFMHNPRNLPKCHQDIGPVLCFTKTVLIKRIYKVCSLSQFLVISEMLSQLHYIIYVFVCKKHG